MAITLRNVVLTVAIVMLGGCGDGAPNPEPEAPTGMPTGTVIEPKQGIAGVRLGSSAMDVEALLGAPDATAPSELHGGWSEWRYRRPRLRITLDQRRAVWNVRTYSPTHRTRQGAGVGSSEREIRDAMGRVHCQPYGGPARYRRWRVCVDTKTYAGPFTGFTLVRGRVRYVTVAQGRAR